jgi:hypothetical protein
VSKPKKGRALRAQLACEAVSVLCARCGEPQPSPGLGSEMWTREDFEKKSGVFDCTACEEPVLISSDPKAQFL